MRRRGAWIAAGAALVVVIAAVLTVLLTTAEESPEERALDILNVIATGDADAIDAEWPLASPDAREALSGSTARISDPEVVSVSEDASGHPIVAVVYTLEGVRQEARLTLEEHDGRFSASDSVVFSEVSFDRTVMIGELVLPAEKTARLLPGAYDVRAAPAEFVHGELHVQAQVSGSQVEAMPVQLSDDAESVAQQQLDEYATECTTPSDEIPDSCGIALPWGADLAMIDSIEYTVEQTPMLSLTLDSFTAGGGVLVATVTGEDFSGATKTLSYRTESWALRGDVSFTADDIVLSVW